MNLSSLVKKYKSNKNDDFWPAKSRKLNWATPLGKENEWKLGHFGLKRGRSGFFLEVGSPGQTTPATIMIVAI